MMYFNKLIKLIIASSILLLVSCGGGGGSESTLPPPGVLNNGLTGKVYLGEDGWILDLASGEYSRILGIELWSDNTDYLGTAIVTVFPVAFSGSEVVETVESCRDISGQISNLNCVKIHDNAGNLIKLITYSGELLGAAKSSRDKEYLVVARQYGGGTSDTYLEIHDRNGNIIHFTVVANSFTDISFDLLPDNRLVYTLGQTVYLTNSLSTTSIPLITFNTDQGAPREISVNPAGDRFVFQLKTDGISGVANHGYIWTMDVDGNNLNRLAVVAGDDNPVINHPAWSPNGEWVLVEEGDVNSGSSSVEGTPGILYAIPSNGVDVPLTVDNTATTAITIYSQYYTVLGISDDELISTFISDGTLAWVP